MKVPLSSHEPLSHTFISISSYSILNSAFSVTTTHESHTREHFSVQEHFESRKWCHHILSDRYHDIPIKPALISILPDRHSTFID